MRKTKEGTRNRIPLFFCDRDRIQTCNRLIRSQLLYSVELRGHRNNLRNKEEQRVTATGFKPVTG